MTTKSFTGQQLFEQYIQRKQNQAGPPPGASESWIPPWVTGGSYNDPAERAKFNNEILPGYLANPVASGFPEGFRQTGADQYDLSWTPDNSDMSQWLAITGAMAGGLGLAGAFGGGLGAGAGLGEAALGGMAAGEGSMIGAGLSSAADIAGYGLGGAEAWGVNQATGGNMDWLDSWADSWSGSGADASGAFSDPINAWGSQGGTGGTFGGLEDLGAQFPDQFGQAAGEAAASSGSMQNLLTELGKKVGTTAAQSLASDLMKNGLTSDNLGKLVGALGPSVLGMLGSSQQAGAQSDLANKYWAAGAPSRARFEASMSPGFDPATSIPGYSGALKTTMDSALAGLSTQGNPFGNPSGLIEANKKVVAGTALPAWDAYQRANAAGGHLGFSQAANFDQGAAAGNNNIWNAAGFGLNELFKPQQDNSLAALLKQFQGLNLGTVPV